MPEETPPTPGVQALRHVIVVMLENRSFDHLLGFLDHPNPAFDGIGPDGRSNPRDPDDASKGAVASVKRRSPRWRVDPDHSHQAIMSQLRPVDGVGRNDGFVASYERKARGEGPGPAKATERRRQAYLGAAGALAAGAGAAAVGWPVAAGVIGGLGVAIGAVGRHMTRRDRFAGDGERIMWSWDPANVKGLSTLALEFGICTRWFCSVPGETWPNRQFAHAATSSGSHDIEARLYYDRTIFEVLEEGGADWGIYFDGPPQVLCYPNLWREESRLARWHSMQDLYRDIEAGSSKLPAYVFVEPNHGYIGKSYSQHPGNNRIGNFDFQRADRFVASIYEALRAKPDLFEETLLVVTWDEHGGTYDHVPPIPTIPPDDGLSRGFDFKTSGVRVPTIVVSPWIARHTVDSTQYDHTSIPKTLRTRFAASATKLNSREDAASDFLGTLTEPSPRRENALPDLSRHAKRPRAAFFPVRWLTMFRRNEIARSADHGQAKFDDTIARLTAAVDREVDPAGRPTGPIPAAGGFDEFGTEELPPEPADRSAVAARVEAKLQSGSD